MRYRTCRPTGPASREVRAIAAGMSEAVDHFLKVESPKRPALFMVAKAEAPNFSAGFLAAAARGRRASGGSAFRGNMRTGW